MRRQLSPHVEAEITMNALRTGAQRARDEGCRRASAVTIDYRPPPAVVAAAKRALELIEHRGKGLLPETVRWARKIARGEPADEAKVIAGAAWHARHAVDRRPGWSNPPTPGYVAYMFWFGAPGRAWFNRLRAQLRRCDRA